MENLDSLFLGLFCFLMGAALVGGVIALRGRALKRRTAGAPPEPDLVEVAQLYRSRKTHRLVVSLDNQLHTSAGELSDDQHKRLSSVAAVLKTWLTEPSTAVQAAAARPRPHQFPAHSRSSAAGAGNATGRDQAGGSAPHWKHSTAPWCPTHLRWLAVQVHRRPRSTMCCSHACPARLCRARNCPGGDARPGGGGAYRGRRISRCGSRPRPRRYAVSSRRQWPNGRRGHGEESAKP